MENRERSNDLYELVPGYQKPPLVPIPPVTVAEIEKNWGLNLNPLTRFILGSSLFISGFNRFLKGFPQNQEDIQRKVNIRGPVLFSPVVSATSALEDDPRDLDMTARAVTLLVGAYKLYKDVWNAELPQDTIKGEPCEMGQYPNFFSTSVIFDNGRPRVYKSNLVNQITVLVSNRVFVLRIDDWETPSVIDQLMLDLNAILSRAEQPLEPEGIRTPTIITCADDQFQYQAFQEIKRDHQNRESLEILKDSFLTLCFDCDIKPETYSESIMKAHSTNFANRWSHSSLQIVIFENSKACAICNFSTYLDGNTMVRGIAEIQKRAVRVQINGLQKSTSIKPQEINELFWNIEQSLIDKTQESIGSVLDDQQATFYLNDIGTDHFEACGLMAVPTFVIALHLAVKRLTGKIISITQFLAMSKYRCMDLTTAVVTTGEVEKFLLHIDGDFADHKVAQTLLKQAEKSQLAKMKFARNHLPISDLIAYFLAMGNKSKRIYANIIWSLHFMLLRKLRALSPVRSNIVISHPIICPEVPLLGRPGVRLPYVAYFGLHYQIFSNSIALTFMPGVNLSIKNDQLISELRKSLDDILRISCGPGDQKIDD